MEQLLNIGFNIALGGLLGVVLWVLRDMRLAVREMQTVLTDFRLEAQRDWVRVEDHRRDIQELDGKFDHLDTRLGKAELALDRVTNHVGITAHKSGGGHHG